MRFVKGGEILSRGDGRPPLNEALPGCSDSEMHKSFNGGL